MFGGKKFKDERAGLAQCHDRRGLVSMGNSGKNSNTSQWFITLDATPVCDGKHVLFGQVVSGSPVLDAIEQLAQPGGGGGGEPVESVVITDCGIWTPFVTPGAGYWYDQPDPESYSGKSPVFRVRPRVAVCAPTVAVADKFAERLNAQNAVVVAKLTTNQDGNDNEQSVEITCQQLMELHAVDVIVVAPASAIPRELQWKQQGNYDCPRMEKFVIQTKPVQAAQAVRTQSWLAEMKDWQLD